MGNSAFIPSHAYLILPSFTDPIKTISALILYSPLVATVERKPLFKTTSALLFSIWNVLFFSWKQIFNIATKNGMDVCIQQQCLYLKKCMLYIKATRWGCFFHASGVSVQASQQKMLNCCVLLWHFCISPPKASFLIRRPNCLWLSSLLKR